MNSVSAATPARVQTVPGTLHRSQFWMRASLVAVDAVTLALSVMVGFAVWVRVNPSIPPFQPLVFSGVVFSICCFAAYGLYGFGKTTVQHLRSIFHGVTLSYMLLTTSMFLVKEHWAESRGGVLLAWLFSLLLVPCGRLLLGRQSWWGVPVIILGAGETARSVIRNLREQQTIGYRPLLCFDDDQTKHGACDGVPVVGTLHDARAYAAAYKVSCAIMAMPQLPRQALVQHLHTWSTVFPNILIVPDLFGVASVWVQTRDLGGVLALQIQHNLLDGFAQFMKRCVDIVVAFLALFIAIPVLSVCALAIWCCDRKSAFYWQEREGRDCAPIKIAKLRTMHVDAERMLQDHLNSDVAAREEWERFCKLREDPRILPVVGHILRKTSLDELPQLWNVLKGEMSLVGPRPFPRYHNDRFNPDFRKLRTQVTPGLTGLWQVSGRSGGELSVQEHLDTYYIRNWSLWLDVYILIRTVGSVLAGEGAY